MTLRLSSNCQFRTKYSNYLQYKVANSTHSNDLAIMTNIIAEVSTNFLLLQSLR